MDILASRTIACDISACDTAWGMWVNVKVCISVWAEFSQAELSFSLYRTPNNKDFEITAKIL